MRCGRTFLLARTHPAHARSSGSETLSRSRSLADYTIDTHDQYFKTGSPLTTRGNFGATVPGPFPPVVQECGRSPLNKLYLGDNLNAVQERIKDETVGVVYLDPAVQFQR